jgi:hypothetical protein
MTDIMRDELGAPKIVDRNVQWPVNERSIRRI